MAEVTQRFGTAEEIAATFFEQYDKEEIKKKINVRKVVVTAVAVAMVMLATALIIALIDNMNTTVNRVVVGKATELSIRVQHIFTGQI